MYTNFPNAQWLAQLGLLPSCGQDFISYLLQQHHNISFLQIMLASFPAEGASLWLTYGTPGPYPGAIVAGNHFGSTAPTPSFQDDFASFLIANSNETLFILSFTSYLGSITLATDIQSFSTFKSCIFSTLGDQTFTILDLYDRDLLWDHMISNSTYSALLSDLETYDPEAFLRTYITLYPNEAIDLMGNSPQGGYSFTDYLNAIMNYGPFGAG